MFTTILRGFRLPVVVLDAFLTTNGLDETFGTPPLRHDAPEISALLRRKMGGGDACVFIPQREAYSRSTVAYVAYCWVKVFTQREINLENDLPEEVPIAFEELKLEMMGLSVDESSSARDESMGRIGTFVVFTGSVHWTPRVIDERNEAPVHCDQCEQTFESFFDKQAHRQDAHGSLEGTNPLPDA